MNTKGKKGKEFGERENGEIGGGSFAVCLLDGLAVGYFEED